MNDVVRPTARRSLLRIGGLAVAIALVLAAVVRLLPTDLPLVASEIDAYSSVLAEVADSWGAIEVLGMRPAVADLRTGEGVPADAIVTQTRAWRSSFDDYRRDLEAMDVPHGLQEAHRLFLTALDRYHDAARLFGDAAQRASHGQSFDVETGIEAAKVGADLFDRAATELQQVRARAGLPAHPAFPSGLDDPTTQGDG